MRNLADYILSYTVGNLYWKDRESYYLGCNLTFSRVAHLNHPSDIVGKSDFDLFGPFLSEKEIRSLIEIDRQVMLNNMERTVEEIGINETGEKAYYISKKVPLKDENDQVIGLIGTSIDITTYKKVELMHKQFMRNFEHDIRTPFAGIYSIAEYLHEQEMDPAKKELLEIIFHSTKALLDYNNAILEFSKLENSAPQHKQVDIRQLLDKVISIELPGAKSKFLDLQFHLTSNLPQYIIIDEYRLTLILINLISNAIKFTRKGHVIVRVNLTKSSFSDVTIQIAVEDTGIGIAKEDQEQIFEKFVQVSAPTKNLFNGIGLGLNIVKQYVNDMRGKVFLESILGKGTTFYCHLPCKLLDNEDVKLE